MDFKQIQELIRLINKSNIGEITVEEKGFKITIKQKQETVQQVLAPPVYAAPATAPALAPAAASSAPAAEKAKPAAETTAGHLADVMGTACTINDQTTSNAPR